MNPIILPIQQELASILSYWTTHAIDYEHGGFYGKIANDNTVDSHAPKGAVLNARILWSFSSAYNFTHNTQYLETAERSFSYIQNFFIDHHYGSVYWSLNFDGTSLNTRKQIYALAFTIYGLTEFYKASGYQSALDTALDIYHDIEKYSHDDYRGGYIEALSQDWQELPDLRLSDKDANEKKTMNTHLHILEAYTNLYRVWPDPQLKNTIIQLVQIFMTHIIDPATHHLILFLDENWNRKSDVISYGHDIEASWLILEAAEITGEVSLITTVKEVAIAMASAAVEGLDKDGSLFYEYDANNKELVKEKHWWVQAEAMVGFLNAWQLSGDQQFYEKFINTWNFIKQHIKDHVNGEWFWGVTSNNTIMQGEDKAGFWKCPYHNSRACSEIARRLMIND